MTSNAPNRPWILHQTWSKLLFAHWPLPAAALHPLLPPGLQPDTFAGQAWLGVVPFYMSGIRFRGLPVIPTTGEFCELNVRTYVTHEGHPGVWFFSLDAASALAVWGARTAFHLPYHHAEMRLDAQGDTLVYASHRKKVSTPPAEFKAHYRPTSPVFQSQPGSLEYWLTERYCLYAADRGGRIYRGNIEHRPWPLQKAEAEFHINAMAEAAGLTLPDTPPLLHYAEQITVRTWYLQRLG